MLNKLRCHTHFYLSANQITYYIVYWHEVKCRMTNSADPDQLASSEANWSGSTLFADRVYLGLAGQLLSTKLFVPNQCSAILYGTNTNTW